MSTDIDRQLARNGRSFPPGAFVAESRWRRFAARLQAALEARAPLGYEDETGFHLQEENASALSGAARPTSSGPPCDFCWEV